MSGINDTAYPQLRAEISDQELISVFTPSATERRFIAHASSWQLSIDQAFTLSEQAALSSNLNYNHSHL